MVVQKVAYDAEGLVLKSVQRHAWIMRLKGEREKREGRDHNMELHTLCESFCVLNYNNYESFCFTAYLWTCS